MNADAKDLNIRGLIIAAKEAPAVAFMRVLEREINLVACDFTDSLFKAVSLFAEIEYDFCFIAEAFPVEEVGVFLKDTKKTAAVCLFAQLREQVAADLDRSQFIHLGLGTIVSSKMNHLDKQALKLGVQTLAREQSFVEVKDNMSDLLAEIDKAAEQKRKGLISGLTAKAFGAIKRNLESHQELIGRYFDALFDQALEITKRKTPEPSMEDQIGYHGASRQLRKKLIKKLKESEAQKKGK